MNEMIKKAQLKRVINAHKYLNKMRKNRIHYQWDITGPRKEYKRSKTMLLCRGAIVNGVHLGDVYGKENSI